MDRENIHDLERADLYASSRFRSGATDIFGADAVEMLDSMLRASAFPGGNSPSADLLAHEAALVIAAMATRVVRPPSVADAARAILAMEYQVEYGPGATSDRKGLRDETQPPQKDFFGSQLATDIRRTGKAGDRAKDHHHQPPALTIGWTWSGDCIGLIHYPQRGKTLVYSTAYLVRNARAGIVRLTNLEFDMRASFELSREAVDRFGKLVFGHEHGDAKGLRRGARSTDG